MKSITVFCGSSLGIDPIFQTTATLLGQKLAAAKIKLVYGGAKVGLMGAVANGALMEGGTVIGVLPKFLGSKEIAHDELTELITVDSMHERKIRMNELCDGVIALPGGFGTLEELFEMLTWAQLGLHSKPIGLLNINGYYDDLINLINTMVDKRFLKDINKRMVLVSDEIEELLHLMQSYVAPEVPKWINHETT